VIRGNVLAIPVNNTIIYVEPIYLQSETSAYPELRLVAVMHNDNLSYAETFDEALRNLFTGEGGGSDRGDISSTVTENINVLIGRAKEAFDDYIRFTQEKEFTRAGEALENLEKTLEQLSERAGEPESNR